MVERRFPLSWRVLRRLLPGWYAAAYGDDVWQTHGELAGGARGARFWLRLASDVVCTSVQLRAQSMLGRLHRVRHFGQGMVRMRQPLRHATRNLVREPAFALTVVMTLGLGIGATVTLFTIVDRVFFSPPAHVQDAEQLRRLYVYGTSIFTRRVDYQAALSWPDYQDVSGAAGFAEIAASGGGTLTLGRGAEAQVVKVEYASASYFPLLRVRPHLGRFFAEDEDRVDAPEAVAVIGYGFWQRQYGGDPAVLGRVVRLGKRDWTIVGVAPLGFTGVNLQPVNFWLPLLTAQSAENGDGWRTARNWYWFTAVARLPEGVDGSAAEEEATARYRAGRANTRESDPDARIVLMPLLQARGPHAGAETGVVRLLGALSIVVLLIACANVANLLLARGVRRRRGLAVQTAIGSSRARLMSLLVLESLLLSLSASIVAVGFTYLAAPMLFRTLLPDALLVSAVSPRLLAVALLAGAACTLLTGLMPALRSTRFDVLEALRTTRESRRGSVLRRGLLFAQAAFSAFLLVGAGMFVKSLERARDRDMGVDLDVLTVSFELEDGTRFGRQLMASAYAARDRLRTLPFVSDAAVTTIPQFTGFWGTTMVVDADTLPMEGRGPWMYGATGGYFEALGLRILRGRALTDEDDRAGGEAVAVVSEGLARDAFPDREVLGACFTLMQSDGDSGCIRVVGVAEDALPRIRAEGPDYYIYLPNSMSQLEGGTVVLRTRGDPTSHIEAVESIARTAAPGVRRVEVGTLGRFLDGELRSWRLGAMLLSAFGLLALVMAGAGLYSVLAFDVAQRRYELGVRSALGAPVARLIRSVIAGAVGVCMIGVVVGSLAASALSRFAATLLFQVRPVEPAVYAVVFATLLAVAASAAVLPALRAVRADPRIALRGE